MVAAPFTLTSFWPFFTLKQALTGFNFIEKKIAAHTGLHDVVFKISYPHLCIIVCTVILYMQNTVVVTIETNSSLNTHMSIYLHHKSSQVQISQHPQRFYSICTIDIPTACVICYMRKLCLPHNIDHIIYIMLISAYIHLSMSLFCNILYTMNSNRSILTHSYFCYIVYWTFLWEVIRSLTC